MQRYLSYKKSKISEDPNRLFKQIRSSYVFRKQHNKFAIIKPLCIITDCYDIVCFVDVNSNIDVGFRTLAKRPKGLFINKNAKNFDKTIEKSIFDRFNEIFATKIGKSIHNNNINDMSMTEYSIKNEDINLHKTSVAIPTMDKKYVYIPYFMILPNITSITLSLNDDLANKIGITPVPVRDYIKTGIVIYEKKMDYISRAVSYMMGMGDIRIPTNIK